MLNVLKSAYMAEGRRKSSSGHKNNTTNVKSSPPQLPFTLYYLLLLDPYTPTPPSVKSGWKKTSKIHQRGNQKL